MASFLTTVLSSGAVKEGLSRGPQSIATAGLFGLPEQFATEALKFRALPGVGLINPALSIFAEPIVSEVKRQLSSTVIEPLFGRGPAQALPRVMKDTAAEKDVLSRVAGEIVNRIPGVDVVRNILGPSGPPEVESTQKQRFEVTKRSNFQSRVGSASIRRYNDPARGTTSKLKEEFVQSHRFYIADISQDDVSVFEWDELTEPNTLAAGFASCSALTATVLTEEIAEGTWEYIRRIPIKVDVEPIVLRKGMIRTRTGFYLWLMNALKGKLTRRTLRLLAYGRSQGRTVLTAEQQERFVGRPRLDNDILDEKPWSSSKDFFKNRVGVWKLVNCIPIAYTAGGDWDASTGDVQFQEIKIACEFFEEEKSSLSFPT